MSTSTTSGTQAKVYRGLEPVTSIVGPSVYLSGPVEPGRSESWQLKMIRHLEHLPVTIFDPRGDHLDAMQEAGLEDVNSAAQIRWQNENLERADVVAAYFGPNSAPSSAFLEVGLTATTNKLIIGCPPSFQLFGRLKIVCEHHNVLLVDTFEELAEKVADKLKGMM